MKKKKRTNYEKIQGIQETLERHGRFDYEYIPSGPGWKDPDKNFPYRKRGLSLLAVGFWRTMMCVIGSNILRIVYGARVRGKQNLRQIQGMGAISVCNHFSFLDTMFVRQAVGHFRSFHTMGPKNNKAGLGGHIIRHGGMLPFSHDLEAVRNLNCEIERLLKKGKIINFYAEQALWTNYQKPRPMKDGAFHYAIKYHVPILPIFCTFRKDRRGHMHRLRIHILPPVFADESLSRRDKLTDMKERAQSEWEKCYRENYLSY